MTTHAYYSYAGQVDSDWLRRRVDPTVWRMDQHPSGERVDVRHMCPEASCGNPPSPFCVVCLGAGSITTDRLDRWQAQVLADVDD